MLVKDKVQIKAIKKGNYMAGKAGNTIMLSEGHYIVYMPEKECMVDISKMKQLPEDALLKYRPDKIEELIKPITLTRKAVVFNGWMARLFENEKTGTRVWINDKYIKMFQGHSNNYVEIGGETDMVFTSCGRIAGLVLPVIVNEE